MALRTYITATEATEYFPNDTDYSAAKRASALNRSFGLVNSYINKEIPIPTISKWDGETALDAPEILKQCQGEFYRYVLQSSNDGAGDELTDAYNATVDKVRGITEGDVTVPTAQIHAHDVGWHINEVNISGMSGEVYIEGVNPIIKQNYKLVVTTGGFPTEIRYDVFSDEQSAAVQTAVAGTYDVWIVVDNTFSIRWAGQWTANDEVHIVGIPPRKINAATSDGPIFSQGEIAFGHNQAITRGPC